MNEMENFSAQIPRMGLTPKIGQVTPITAMGKFTITKNSVAAQANKPVRSKRDEVVFKYLIKHSEGFVDLDALREIGWNNPDADKYFKDQRRKADNADASDQLYFYEMMVSIGERMHQATGAMTPDSAEPDTPINILDICMAPGGYSAAAVKLNPTARIYGLTLSREAGGHNLVILQTPEAENVREVVFQDVTYFVPPFSATMLPHLVDHVSGDKFVRELPFAGQKFDLIFCDGQTLRTHSREEYRDKGDSEPCRLKASQMIIGLWKIKLGGTLIVKLHNLDTWDTANMIKKLENFSKIQLYKPERNHADKGSFYLICKAVQTGIPEFSQFVAQYTAEWWALTIESLTARYVEMSDEVRDAEDLMKQWGKELIQVAEPIWEIQKKALERREWAGGLRRKENDPGTWRGGHYAAGVEEISIQRISNMATTWAQQTENSLVKERGLPAWRRGGANSWRAEAKSKENDWQGSGLPDLNARGDQSTARSKKPGMKARLGMALGRGGSGALRGSSLTPTADVPGELVASTVAYADGLSRLTLDAVETNLESRFGSRRPGEN